MQKDKTNPSQIPAGKVEPYRWTLPAASPVFLPGHRIMVQIQSTWFPLDDRNPQTYVDNIFQAKPEDYRKAFQRVYQTGKQASYIDLAVVKSNENAGDQPAQAFKLNPSYFASHAGEMHGKTPALPVPLLSGHDAERFREDQVPPVWAVLGF